MTDANTIALLLPEIVLIFMAVCIFLFGFGGRSAVARAAATTITLLTFAVSAIALYRQGLIFDGPTGGGAFSGGSFGPLLTDQFAQSVRWLAVCTGALLTLVAAYGAPKNLTGEYLGSLLLIVAGLMLASSAGDLVLLFLALELISIPTYAVLFMGRGDPRSAEATAKYFYLSVLSSILLLYGFSFVYGMAGTTRLADIHQNLHAHQAAGDAMATLLPVALVLIYAGLGFKIAAVPLHFYAPDVYQGTTNANAALLAVVPKIAGVAVLIRLVGGVLPATPLTWQVALALSVLTMTLGNVCALWQKNMRRLLAYSSIAHAGYMLIGLTVGLVAGVQVRSFGGVAAMLFYLVAYCIASLGSFAVLARLGDEEGEVERIDQLAGLGRSHPVLAAAMAVFMFSLAGVPPLLGFWGKLALFTSALTAATAEPEVARWMIALAVVGAINAAIAAGYYLRVVSVMYFREAEQPVEARGGRGAHAVALICAGLLVVVGCMPSGLVEQSRRARPAAIRAAGAERTASTTHDAVRREGARTHLFRLSAKPER